MVFPNANLKRQQDIASLRNFFEVQMDGDDVLWVKIEHETGVAMNEHGRALAREALRKLRRPYIPIRGDGIRLSAPDNALDIMGSRFKAIDRKVRHADTTRTQLSDRHMPAMDEVTQQKMNALAGFFGTVRAIAKSADKLVFARLKMHAERVVARNAEKKPPGI